ncbi:hypothetical protein NMXN1568_2266 [Neisseria meningitidis N1568]|nr:hypothetical protein NMXN1568_2266 [Neisseria meningitidis N1568]
MFTFICIVFIKSLQINVNIRLMRTVVSDGLLLKITFRSVYELFVYREKTYP